MQNHGYHWKPPPRQPLQGKPLRTAYIVDKMLDTLSANLLTTRIPSVHVFAKEMGRNATFNHTFQSNLVDHVLAQSIQDVPDPTQIPPVPNR